MNATLSLLDLPLGGARHRFVRHPFYGKVRVIRLPSRGSSKEHWMYDPDYEPELPPGAVRGDVTKQVFCSACHVPKYFYVDKEAECLQCGYSFTFGATEQKYWYETLKFNFHSAAVRCSDCRRLRRSERTLREQIAHAKRLLEAPLTTQRRIWLSRERWWNTTSARGREGLTMQSRRRAGRRDCGPKRPMFCSGKGWPTRVRVAAAARVNA
jgi:Probable zinc-ribbon domain